MVCGGEGALTSLLNLRTEARAGITEAESNGSPGRGIDIDRGIIPRPGRPPGPRLLRAFRRAAARARRSPARAGTSAPSSAAAPAGEREQLLPVRAREVRHRAQRPLAPEQLVPER